MKGKMIYVCGIDGAGKETITTKLSIQNNNYLSINAFEPHKHSNSLKDNVKNLNEFDNYYTSKIKTLSFFMDMFDNCINKYYLLLDEGYNILFNQYYLSSKIYAPLLGTDEGFVNALCKLLREPDYIIYLKVDPGIACERLRNEVGKEILDKHSLEIATLASQSYESFIDNTNIRSIVIDANKGINEVINEINSKMTF